MATRTWLGFLLLALSLRAEERAPQNDSIRREELRADLFFLAGDALQGRLTNTPGNAIAAEWIKARFERLGLKPGGTDGSYFHAYNLMRGTLGEDNLLEIAGEGSTPRLRPGQDWYPLSFSASARAIGPVIFAGYGIAAPKLGHDDYRGRNFAGAVVLAFDDEPGEHDPNSPFDGVVRSEEASPLRKALSAQAKGAAAILFVRDVHNHSGRDDFDAAYRTAWPAQPPRIARYSLASWVEKVHIPAAQISPALAAMLFERAQRTLADAGRAAETRGGAPPVDVGGRVEITTSVRREIVPDRSVLAVAEGADPRLKDEYVVVSAHLDHDGADGARVFNGADDDGSGTVALLEIAEAYALAARAGQRPRRSVLFAAWNSEERGLFGAWAYADEPLVPRDRIVAVLNMDMLGRNEEVREGGGTRFRGLELQTAESNANAVNVIGTTRSADLKGAVERANRGFALDLRFRYDNNVSNLMRRSDHWPFLQHGIPALWFHTGLHPDYHTIYDRPEKILYAKVEKIARMIHQMSWDLAQQEGRPRLTAASR
jgi:hypothetical protein